MKTIDTAQATDYANDIPRQLAMTAYTWTSQHPERRGEQTIADYVTTLTEDRNAFLLAAEAGRALHLIENEFTRYREGLRKRWVAAVASDSRCASWFVTGPSNFPARRMQKRNDIAGRRWQEVTDFRARAKSAILRKLRPDLAPIMSSDDDATDRLAVKIAKA